MSKNNGNSQVQGIRPVRHEGDIPKVNRVDAPLVHGIPVGWGDCDPAQIAYTANIPRWQLQALDAWYQACLGPGWYEINLDHGIGTPFVNLNLDFTAPITPRFPLLCTVYVSRVGNKSVSHLVEGHQDDRLCFSASSTAVFVDAATFAPIAIPANMRHSMQHYASVQGRVFPQEG